MELHMESKQNFGAYICRCRKALGLTQREFADRLFVTESAVSKWERGLSYPDITLIHDICAVLGISEHELLTASEDVEARTADTLARKYLRLARNIRRTQYIIYGGTALICLICNLAIFHTLDWFWIVLTAEMLGASLTLVPVLVPRQKGLFTLGAFTVSLELLLLASCLFSGGDWFGLTLVATLFGLAVPFLPAALRSLTPAGPLARHKVLLCMGADSALLILLLWVSAAWSGADWFPMPALPGVLYGIGFAWAIALILRYLPAGRWWKSSACLAVCTALMLTINPVLDRLCGPAYPGRVHGFGFWADFSNWSDPMAADENIALIVTLCLAAAAVVFALLGLRASLRRRSRPAEDSGIPG